MAAMTIERLNGMDRGDFVQALGSIFEHSPWVAERAWDSRPFRDKEDLHRKMIAVVENGSERDKIAFFRRHPDLASRLRMSDYSVKEQQGAGLTDLSAEEYAEFRACNESYASKLGFPFIIAVKGKTKTEILAAMKTRANRSAEEEIRQAMKEISDITRYRIEDHVQ